jgi:tripartite-type tricarboxylate transporter receptor subunit TctC
MTLLGLIRPNNLPLTQKATMSTIQRRTFLSAAACGLVAASPSAWAAYPDKPIKLIVPWAPGGSTDAIARALAQRMGETMGQSVIVDNKAGAAGQIGTDFLAKSAPDGYSLGIVELPHAIAPAVVAKLPYDLLRDFSPVTLIGTSPLILFTGNGADSADYKTFVRKAAQGQAPAIAHSGSGTVSHLVGEMFAARTKIKFNQVPYRGSAPALIDVASGQVAAHFATLASGASLLSAGKIRALAVTSNRRMDVPSMRSVPTLAELGVKDMALNQWWALVAPATTPLDVLDKLRLEAISAMASPAVQTRMATLGVDLKGSTRDDLRAFMRTEAQRWQAVALATGLTPQ